MTKRDKAGHKTVADHLLELIRNEDNRHQVRQAFGLEVDPELPPTLASLLDAIEDAHKETLNYQRQVILQAAEYNEPRAARRCHSPMI